ncbi:hypothetical protein BDV96DRAFT_644558 [Lophiotrema nucula]|uniref:Uncharacterized protein n=1 Tax=Lophiotrema nucula TaxID=690887 RepID=A0A6A5ZDI5_9PLEO|nr:hypothetical protein BDV96DRAFT_644558 [Lophiotrema nucula]
MADLSNIAQHSLPNLQQINLSCRWNWGQSKAWFDEHLDSFRVKFSVLKIILVAFDEVKKPQSFVQSARPGPFDTDEGIGPLFETMFSISN